MNLVLVDDTPEGRIDPELPAQGGPTSRAEENYWPMFWSSVQAALLTVVAEFAFTFYLALQWGIRVELRLWGNVLPYMAMSTDRPTFEDVIRVSSLLTAAVLAAFSIIALVRRRRLQVQAGRAFGWIDMALIGVVNLSRAWWFDISLQPARWMYALVLVGLVGFVVTGTLVKIDFDDREAELDEAPSESDAPPLQEPASDIAA